MIFEEVMSKKFAFLFPGQGAQVPGMIEDICDAAENNSQVKWILDDEDVKEFYNAILSNVDYSSLSDGATKRIIDLLRKGESQNTEDENASEDKL